MRILKILVWSVVAVLVLALVVLFIFITTFDANRFKPQIRAASEKALGRPVDFKAARVGVSLTRGLSLNIEDFSIREDESFGKGNFLEVDSVSVGLEVIPLVTKRSIRLTDIVVQSPLVNIVKKDNGTVNVQTIGTGRTPAGGAQQQSLPAAAGSGGPEVLAAPLVYARSVSLRDAVVKYRDESFTPPLEFSISAIDATVNHFSLDKAWKFRIQAALLSPDQNLSFTGTGLLVLPGPEFTLRDGDLAVDLDTVDLMQLKKLLATLPPDAVPSELGGKASLNIKELKVAPPKLVSLVVEANLREGKIRTKKMAQSADTIRLRAGLTESLCTVHELSASLGKGRFSARGQIDDYLSRRRFKAEAQLDDIELKEIIDQKDSDVLLEGLLQGSLKLSGEGLSPDSLSRTLQGEGKLEVTKSQVKGVNVLHLALSKITVLPNLMDALLSAVPENYRDKLTRDSTFIERASFDASIDSGVMRLEPLSVEADGFIFSGQGLAALNRTFSFDGNLAIPQDISQRMISGTKELSFLADERGMVSFPFTVRGQEGRVSFAPDLEYISSRFIAAQGTQQVDKLLDKVFGSGEDLQGESADGAGDGTAREVSTERQILEGVLDKILQ